MEIDFFGPITREIIQNYIGTGVDLDSVPYDDPSNTIALELNTCSHLSGFRISLKATAVSEPLSHIAYLQIRKAYNRTPTNTRSRGTENVYGLSS